MSEPVIARIGITLYHMLLALVITVICVGGLCTCVLMIYGLAFNTYLIIPDWAFYWGDMILWSTFKLCLIGLFSIPIFGVGILLEVIVRGKTCDG